MYIQKYFSDYDFSLILLRRGNNCQIVDLLHFNLCYTHLYNKNIIQAPKAIQLWLTLGLS